MPPDIRTAEGAILEARAQVETWRNEFMAAWYAPTMKLMAGMLLAQIDADPRLAAELEKRNPGALDAMRALIGE